jgi:hypothetical protein
MRNLKGFSATGPLPEVLLAVKGVPFMPCMECGIDADGMDETCVDVCVDDVCVGSMVPGTVTGR